MQRRQVLQAAAVLAGAAAIHVRAQSHVVTVVVGFSAGAAPDVALRFLVPHLSPELGGRNVIVDNRPGAGGQLAFAALRQASADGTLFAFVPSNLLTTFPLIYSKLPYEAADVTPIATACTFDFSLAVAADHPARTLAQFVDWCKANPKKASLGNPGLGTPHHFFGWLFGRDAGIEIEAVPYRSTPQMAQETASGQVAASIAASPLFIELVRGGKLRVLATTGEARTTAFPDVPTFIEAGYPALKSVEWFGFFGRAGTPQPVLDQLASAVRTVVARDDVAAQLRAMGFTPVVHDAAWLDRVIKADYERWADVVRRTGFKASS
ncbi:MAG: hypothetical protein LT106_00355 [Burkholderiaceae bacterium]|nr:hypothetical protein [Burkholderiaceae bacterium]